MMRPRLAGFLGFSLSVLLALAAPVSAQQATIAGRVVDGSTMQPLASVQVPQATSPLASPPDRTPSCSRLSGTKRIVWMASGSPTVAPSE